MLYFCSEVRTMRLFRRKITFDQAVRFNYELDCNEKLKTALKNLSLSQSEMGKKKYLSELLRLFREEGLDLSLKELDMLLLLRQKTGQLLEENRYDINIQPGMRVRL